jgi:2-polyprenyl-6-methoxyphenol hydroxylase-like FAD-dependent oxidoreductase
MRTRAVVLGGSVAGLLAARVLADSFDHVVVVDRDDLSRAGPRKGVPQAHHAHGILAKGREVVEELFPGLTEDLVASGGIAVDLHNDIAWFKGACPLHRAPSGLLGLCVSRPALEDYIRGRVASLPAVEMRGGHVAVHPLATDDREVVTGVQVVRLGGNVLEDLEADLVVDATGRGNRGNWLKQLGYNSPSEESVEAGLVYVTRQYVREGPLPSGARAMISSASPRCPYSVVMIPNEGNRWIVTLIGTGVDIPPVEAGAFHEFAHRLDKDDLRYVIDHSRPLTEPKQFRLPATVRRRYESLRASPEGYVVLGDALCSFNPVYGQGMTVAAVEAVLLRDCLDESRDGVPARFYQEAARFIDVPWNMSSGGDLAALTPVGIRTLKTRLFKAYLAKVLRVAENDTQVSLAFHQTVNLTSSPGQLFTPRMLKRVFFPSLIRSTEPPE